MGGGKGWPTNACVFIYHREQGLFITGSQSGAIYAYGDGFQYMKTPIDYHTPEAVIFLLSISDTQILVVYEDNSMIILDLPSLTPIPGAFLPSTWLLSNVMITCIRRDETNHSSKEKLFVYVGTSDGTLYVLDCTVSGQIRECDYIINLQDVHISEQGISDIQGEIK